MAKMEELDVEDIVQRYQAGETMVTIAKVHNTNIDKVRLRLKKAGVYKQVKPGKVQLDEEAVIEMYKSDITIADIVKKLNLVSDTPVVSLLKKHNIRKPNWLKSCPWKVAQQISDKEFFEQLHKEKPAMYEKAEFFNCGLDLIRSAHERHGIPIPSSGEVRSLINQRSANVKFTKKEYSRLYEEGMPIYEIADNMGVTVAYLTKIVNEQGWNNGRETIPSIERKNPERYEILNSKEKLAELLTEHTVIYIAEQLNIWPDTVYFHIKRHGLDLPVRYRSAGEQQIAEYIERLGVKVVANDRTIIAPYELDIVLPDHKIAIEYCGLYWHSELVKEDKKYHVDKLKRCIAQGYRLITIFEDEYLNSPEKVKSKLADIIGVTDNLKINARQCTIKEIPVRLKNEFLDANHIQGSDLSSIRLGLFSKEVLVAVMTFAKPNRSRNSASAVATEGLWELNRYATKRGCSVRGGASKLVSYFKKNYDWSEIFSYADLRWSEGKMYETIGFELTNTSDPNYWYVKPGGATPTREYRYKYAKFKLVEEGYDPDKTEREIMEERGYTRIWDCGMLKYSLKKPA